jgi:2-amino-4-hydroxy-6-hydroxymethyldihydropteridine diphosphokinase
MVYMARQVYLGLGGNERESLALIRQALQQIERLSGVRSLCCSRFYRTRPVSLIPQASYVNAVCRLETTLDAHALFDNLRKIESYLGKIPKPKDAPRPIDIDILFYGSETINDAELTIPHPHWHERLFVLAPLMDLTDEVALPNQAVCNLIDYMKEFPNKHQEAVEII